MKDLSQKKVISDSVCQEAVKNHAHLPVASIISMKVTGSHARNTKAPQQILEMAALAEKTNSSTGKNWYYKRMNH